MSTQPTLDDLWNSALPATRTFDPAALAHLPEPARRYLTHAIAPGTPLASAVRLKMHGEIKLKGPRRAVWRRSPYGCRPSSAERRWRGRRPVPRTPMPGLR
ncbi:MAG TPA: DUF6544 family protein [Thermoanaerobaculia bacterium]